MYGCVRNDKLHLRFIPWLVRHPYRVFVSVHHAIVLAEEYHLETVFGQKYIEYRNRVRRVRLAARLRIIPVSLA